MPDYHINKTPLPALQVPVVALVIAWTANKGVKLPDEAPAENREGTDIYFLVDRSGSMAGEKWAKTAEALIAFVNAAAHHDRVWITFFESDYRDVAEKPMERDELLRESNFQSIADLGTGGGNRIGARAAAYPGHPSTILDAAPQPYRYYHRWLGWERGGRFAGSFRARFPRSLFRNRPCGQRGIPPPTGSSTAGNPRRFLTPNDDLRTTLALSDEACCADDSPGKGSGDHRRSGPESGGYFFFCRVCCGGSVAEDFGSPVAKARAARLVEYSAIAVARVERARASSPAAWVNSATVESPLS